jgi:AraC-like DNA-binding protein
VAIDARPASPGTVTTAMRSPTAVPSRMRKSAFEEYSPAGPVRQITIHSHYEAVDRVIKVMREGLSEPLTLQDMADAAMFSPYYLNRVFRRVTGLPPRRFLAAMRLASAKRLLLTTPLTSTDICFRIGYNSYGTFITRFTERVGLAPQRLRSIMPNPAGTPCPSTEWTSPPYPKGRPSCLSSPGARRPSAGSRARPSTQPSTYSMRKRQQTSSIYPMRK